MDESSDVLKDEKKEHPFVFFITIVSARGLPKTTGGVTSNPFIRVKYNEQRYRTSTVPKSLQPIWNESFIFPYQPTLKALLSVYDCVSFGRDTVIGDVEILPPQPYQPLAKWFSVKARNRSVLDIGRVVVEQRDNESIGQIFIAMTLLDPLELTLIGQQGFEIADERNDRSLDDWPSVHGVATSPSPIYGSSLHSYTPIIPGIEPTLQQTPKRRASALRTMSTPQISFTDLDHQQLTPPPPSPLPLPLPHSLSHASSSSNSSPLRKKKLDRRKSFRHQSIDSTVGALRLFQEMKAIRLRILIQFFNRWRILSYFLEEFKLSEEGTKKLLMESKFKTRAASHKIKALQLELANIHSEKYQREMITLRAQKEIKNELYEANKRAEIAELLVKQLEEELMRGREWCGETKQERGEREGGEGEGGREKGGRERGRRTNDIMRSYSSQRMESLSPPPLPTTPMTTVEKSRTTTRPTARATTLTPPPTTTSTSTPPSSLSSVNVPTIQNEQQVELTNHSMEGTGKYPFLAYLFSLKLKYFHHKLLLQSFLRWKFIPSQFNQTPSPTTQSSSSPAPTPAVLAPASSAASSSTTSPSLAAVAAAAVAPILPSKSSEETTKSYLKEFTDLTKKYNDLKKQTATYKEQVKAHWSKTEIYIKKIKEMAADERRKRTILKTEMETLTTENNVLKLKLETKRIDEQRYSLNLRTSLSGGGGSSESSLTPSRSDLGLPISSITLQHSNSYNSQEMESPVRPSAGSRPSSMTLTRTSDQKLIPSIPVQNEELHQSPLLQPSHSNSQSFSQSQLQPQSQPQSAVQDVSTNQINDTTQSLNFEQVNNHTTQSLNEIDIYHSNLSTERKPETQSQATLPDSSFSSDYPLETTQFNETNDTSFQESSYQQQQQEQQQQEQQYEAVNQLYSQSYDGDYYYQWETLYSEAQQQLVAEMSAKEESLRTCEYLREQLETIQMQAQKERELYEQIIHLMSTNPQQQIDRSTTPPPVVTHSETSRLRVRRQSVPNLSTAIKTRTPSTKRVEESNRTIGFSSKLFRVVSQSEDNDSDDEDEDRLSVPALPDLDITSTLDELNQSEVTQPTILIENPAIEDAMTAKIRPRTSNIPIQNEKNDMNARPILSSSSTSSIISSSSSKFNKLTSEDEQMDSLWHLLTGNNDSSTSLDGSTNVRVAIRMRPLNARELDLQSHKCIHMIGGTEVVVNDPEAMQEHRFNFDFCFDTTAPDSDPNAGSQQITFEKIGVEVLANAWKGYNASLFAYGQTGSGKSYSMMGSESSPGIIPRICRALFYLIRRYNLEQGLDPDETSPEDRPFTVEASYLEIYNEKIRDLLDPTRHNLRVREHPTTGVFVENLSTCAVENYKDVEDLLEMGLEQRTTASTNMNNESSRSHSVFTITIRFQSTLPNGKKAVRMCKLCLVDLAGSERANATGATGARLKEGANINRSLSTLGRCISALAKVANEKMKSGNNLKSDKVPIPFRESVLTWLLRESLCGNAKTTMLATISPAGINYGESLSTLRYAFSAKQIFTQAVVNEDPTTKIITDLRNEVLRLRDQLLAQGSRDEKKSHLSPEVTQKLLKAEETLRNYAKQWETKQQSMKMVKSKLLKKKFASFGTEDLHDEEIQRTPYIISLSSDPMLNLAVKIYLPIGNILRIGKAFDSSQSNEPLPDLQIDGLGIAIGHCILHHNENGQVTITTKSTAITYLNGRQLTNPNNGNGYDYGAGNGNGNGNEETTTTTTTTVQLNANDRLVLGICSHVFAFIDPNQSNRNIIPTYEQAVREVILGRGETENEKKERLAALIWNLWKAPRHRRIFEERLVDALKGVREAMSLTRQICPSSGIYFETTLTSSINFSALYSLKIKDLFEYSNIMIRVRCCSAIIPQLKSFEMNQSYDIQQMSYIERIAQCSITNSMAIPMTTTSTSSSSSSTTTTTTAITTNNQIQNKRRHSSFTAQLQQNWKTNDIILLFESQLINFMEGVEVLRELCDSTRDLRQFIDQQRNNLQIIQYETTEFHDDQWAISLMTSLIKLTKGDEESQSFEYLMSSCDYNLTTIVDYLTHYLTSITSIYDLNISIIPSLFQYFLKLTSISNALLHTLDASLHEAIISCYESSDLLVSNHDLISQSHSNIDHQQQSHSHSNQLIPDEVTLLLQQLASLREESVPTRQSPSSYKLKSSSYSLNSNPINEFPSSSSVSVAAAASVADTLAVYSDQDSHPSLPLSGDVGDSSGANDWVTYYDESSGRYYLYSESQGESKWIDS